MAALGQTCPGGRTGVLRCSPPQGASGPQRFGVAPALIEPQAAVGPPAAHSIDTSPVYIDPQMCRPSPCTAIAPFSLRVPPAVILGTPTVPPRVQEARPPPAYRHRVFLCPLSPPSCMCCRCH